MTAWLGAVGVEFVKVRWNSLRTQPNTAHSSEGWAGEVGTPPKNGVSTALISVVMIDTGTASSALSGSSAGAAGASAAVVTAKVSG